MKLIVGLGNPGEKYKNTRHNLGFEAVDALAHKLVVSSSWLVEEKFKSEIIRVKKLPTINQELLLVKPATYMNNSGMAVKLLTNYYQLPTTNLIIIHDDLDLPLGKIKVRLGGSAAGHHGVESIISYLGTDKFIRVRLGIGNLKTALGEKGLEHISAEKFVLEPFMPGERFKVKQMVKKTTQAVEILLRSEFSLSEGLEKAQNL